MTGSKEQFEEMREQEMATDEFTPLVEKPLEIQLAPGTIIKLSKESAATFHQKTRTMIMETGYGGFEYLETIQFFKKLDEEIRGEGKKPGDKEFMSYIREEIAKYPKAQFTTERGVKFENAEVGNKYDFTNCGDQELIDMEAKAEELAEKIKAKREFLKTVPAEGLDIISAGGEVVKVYPPAKKSTSSFKITMAK